jgi:uncharacterized protein YnzC (UPF0291/DUF896 family)
MSIDLNKYKKATTTPQSTGSIDLSQYKSSQAPQNSNGQAPEENKPGLFQNIVRGVSKPFLKAASSFAPAAESVYAAFSPDFSLKDINKRNIEGRDFGYFGENIRPLGAAASEVSAGQKSVGRGALDMLTDTAGTALEAGSYAIGGGALPGIAKNTVKGKIIAGAAQGARAGGAAGGVAGLGIGLQEEDRTVGSVAKDTAVGAASGLVAGAAFGGILPVPGAVARGGRALTDPVGIMNRVARINPTQARNFKKNSGGASHGEWLVERGIFGTDEEIAVQLATRSQQAYKTADAELAKLGGEWKVGAVDDALEELLQRETRVSTANTPSRDMARVTQLVNKNKENGLSMSEINEVKRVYERNVRLDYLKSNVPESIDRAKNIDSAIRNWQFEQADKLGFQNLKEINKETQLSRELGDALYARINGQVGNNAVSLTDAVLLAGGNPQSVAMAASRQFFGNQKLQSGIARKMAPKPTVGAPAGMTRNAQTQNLLPPASGASLINDGRPIPVMSKNSSQVDYTGREKTVAVPTRDSSTLGRQQQGLGQLLKSSDNTTPGQTPAQPVDKRFTESEASPMFQTVKDPEIQLQEIDVQLTALDESVMNSPARQLMKYLGRGDNSLAQIQKNAEKTGGKSINMDSIVTELGYKDIEEAQAAIDDYLVQRARLSELEEQKKVIKYGESF